MNKLKKVFNKVQEFSSDIYVADYTNQTNSEKGVYIQDAPFADIESFHLHNEHKILLIAVNLEENNSIFSRGDENCECLIRVKNCNKGWVLLCELKYCKEKNIVENTDKAYNQLRNTWEVLVNKKIITKKIKSYFNISIPDYSNKAPFTSFSFSQNDKLEWMDDNKIKLLGYNDVLVINEGILNVPTKEI